MRVAMLQMTSGIDPVANCAAVVAALHEAASGGADMLTTPEMALLLDRDRPRAALHIVAEDENAEIEALRAACAATGVWLHLGSAPVRDDASGKWRNRSLMIDGDGNIVARYDKIHLFDVDLASGESWRESGAYAAGEQAVVAPTPWCDIGLSICYDLRFPALYSALSGAGATVIMVPAAFTVSTGEAHWHMLLRARAVENACFVIAAAQSGEHADGRTTYGHSLAISPWGDVLLDMGEGQTLAVVDLDLDAIEATRSRIPVIRNRREFAGPVVAGQPVS